MRAIKFRAWDIKNKCFVGKNCHLNFSDNNIVFDDGSQFRINGAFEIMQFTGTMDNNLKEIYEGDLLILNGDKLAMFEVFYHDDEARFKCCRTHYAGNRCGGYVPEMTSKNLTVIGNIYENKELL